MRARAQLRGFRPFSAVNSRFARWHAACSSSAIGRLRAGRGHEPRAPGTASSGGFHDDDSTNNLGAAPAPRSSLHSRRAHRARCRSSSSQWRKNRCSARSRQEPPSSRRSSCRRRATSCSAPSRRLQNHQGQVATRLADQANVDAQLAEATAREHKSHQADMELEASLQALRQEASHDPGPPPAPPTVVPVPVPVQPPTQ